jgi:hypothetical protein
MKVRAKLDNPLESHAGFLTTVSAFSKSPCLFHDGVGFFLFLGHRITRNWVG